MSELILNCHSSHNVMQLFKLCNSNIHPLYQDMHISAHNESLAESFINFTVQFNMKCFKMCIKKRWAELPPTAFHFNTLEWRQSAAAAQHPCVFCRHQCVCVCVLCQCVSCCRRGSLSSFNVLATPSDVEPPSRLVLCLGKEQKLERVQK